MVEKPLNQTKQMSQAIKHLFNDINFQLTDKITTSKH